MTDNDLESLYKANIGISHFSALRAVWDSGYNVGSGSSPVSQGIDPSAMASAVTATTGEPTPATDPSLAQP